MTKMRFLRMRHAKRLGPTLAVGVLLVALATSIDSAPALAGSKTAQVSFGTFESVARAANGDTVTINGEGTFTLQPKSITGDGGAVAAAFGEVPRTFTHRDAQGNILAEGTWELTAVLSFESFGPATPAQEAEFGGLPPGSEGGKVMFKAALFVGGAHVHDAIITIYCHLGEPRKNVVEATLVHVQGTKFNFNEVVSGDNIFIGE
jgi:hypothetical protein